MPTANFESPSSGQDLWLQLKRVQIPVFSGDKLAYQSWKAAFLVCIDSAPATGEYKLLQPRQYLSGEALKMIENLGYSGAANEAAKQRLEQKFGGMRRQISIYIEKLNYVRQIHCGSFMFLFCLVFAMSLCASVYMCFVVTSWERADLLALVCGV